MASKVSAGLLMYRVKNQQPEVFLVHPGGPFWSKKDAGAWSTPKGEVKEGESLLETAQREFAEETGLTPKGPYLDLGSTRLKSGKIVHSWAFEGDWNGMLMSIATISIEWPPKSGKFKEFPEVDKAAFFSLEQAKIKIHEAQRVFLTNFESLFTQNKLSR